jgi:hypothetical protein
MSFPCAGKLSKVILSNVPIKSQHYVIKKVD